MAAYQPERIYLFGSRARGDAGPDSDDDLLVAGCEATLLDQLSISKLVVRRLEKASIPYMLTGSIAASHYGRPRMTRDLDLVVELDVHDANRIENLFGRDFVVNVDGVRAAVLRRGMFNMVHRSALSKVDMVVRKDNAYPSEEFRRRRRVRVGEDVEVWMATAEDLVLSKLVWAKDSRSEVQLNDVRSILRVQAALDWRYLEGWAARLTVAGLLQEVR